MITRIVENITCYILLCLSNLNNVKVITNFVLVLSFISKQIFEKHFHLYKIETFFIQLLSFLPNSSQHRFFQPGRFFTFIE